ncbi:SMI1/KNR4 family protein [Niallia sp. NCCP-28]|uniref:SMI1/KNR4 family protein n=1 Tax=Niallia sp. NCCP-28 TaxID=2934712 RepID=UPI0020848511|nr:SMI1/KNR4 family protein [Niallia sp. NCCP-28]GKU82941.1 hypothetical protein NCCP28_23370 [Niallia sp. NCCP-28]
MNIWKKDQETYKLSKLTKADIQMAEDYFDVTLPEQYINLLKVQNGGVIIFNALPIALNRYDGDTYIEIDHLLGIKKGKGILETEYYKKEWDIQRENIILISGDGHSWIALDYNESENPAIIFIETDEGEITEIYKSFDEMIRHLFFYELNEDESDNEERKSPAIEDARRLINSKEIEFVFEGIDIYENFIYEKTILFEFLNHIEKLLQHQKEDLRAYAARSLWNIVIYEYLTDLEVIKKLMNIMKNDTDSDVQRFKEQIEIFIANN